MIISYQNPRLNSISIRKNRYKTQLESSQTMKPRAKLLNIVKLCSQSKIKKKLLFSFLCLLTIFCGIMNTTVVLYTHGFKCSKQGGKQEVEVDYVPSSPACLKCLKLRMYVFISKVGVLQIC